MLFYICTGAIKSSIPVQTLINAVLVVEPPLVLSFHVLSEVEIHLVQAGSAEVWVVVAHHINNLVAHFPVAAEMAGNDNEMRAEFFRDETWHSRSNAESSSLVVRCGLLKNGLFY